MSINLSRRTKRGAAVALTFAVAGGGTLAYAYWSSTGNGSGNGTTGTAANFVVTSEAPVGAALTPGGPTQTVTFHVQNPGTGGQFLTSVLANVKNANNSVWTVAAANGAGCSLTDFEVGTPDIEYGEIAAGDTIDGTVTLALLDRAGVDQDDCKSQTVPLYFAAS